jgi:HSP20 family protein
MLNRSVSCTPALSLLFGSDLAKRLPSFQRAVDPFLFATKRSTDRFPAINILSNENEVVVRVELPGFKAGEVEVTLDKDKLKLTGEQKSQGLAEGEKKRLEERWSGAFERTIQLPFDVASDGINAEFSDGVLDIKLPKTEASKPKQIVVKAA